MEIDPHRRWESVGNFACVMTQAVLAKVVQNYLLYRTQEKKPLFMPFVAKKFGITFCSV